uniref:Uncharacterized protein n=1 Tax=Stephanocyclus meneghinianus TaxID=29205 RepID=A0A7S1KLD9_STEMN|mmetsp:Transcript_117/g.131  ORF Transcript_117/g.131 Transcript_117/m.131 type:complete len:206 (+) Transcript_117:153-770(+)|eukprot:scaffold26080_cov43-Cyclotella_meneghiniana.AAC.4
MASSQWQGIQDALAKCSLGTRNNDSYRSSGNGDKERCSAMATMTDAELTCQDNNSMIHHHHDMKPLGNECTAQEMDLMDFEMESLEKLIETKTLRKQKKSSQSQDDNLYTPTVKLDVETPRMQETSSKPKDYHDHNIGKYGNMSPPQEILAMMTEEDLNAWKVAEKKKRKACVKRIDREKKREKMSCDDQNILSSSSDSSISFDG